jgi:hypothetical protein
MKTLAFFFCVAVQTLLAQESIKPKIASEFGKHITVQAEFIPKPNDYYSQNIVAAPYTLKVFAVDGRKLKEPVIIEYNLHAEKKSRTKIERLGASLTFEAYESLYQPGFARPWLAPGEQGMGFALIHVLHVRLPPAKD